jgi:hypothetical protein
MVHTWSMLGPKLGGIIPLYPYSIIPNPPSLANMGGRPLGRQAAVESGWLAPPTANHPPTLALPVG